MVFLTLSGSGFSPAGGGSGPAGLGTVDHLRVGRNPERGRPDYEENLSGGVQAVNHLEHIRSRLAGAELDALIITSEPGEFYAVGMKGEGLVLVTREESCYFTDSRYIELAEQSIEHAVVTMATSDRPQLMLAGEALALLTVVVKALELPATPNSTLIFALLSGGRGREREPQCRNAACGTDCPGRWAGCRRPEFQRYGRPRYR